ncbi:uncharacterized protein [Oncorhynchus clarkii lewisi]|uniref:uncharacterized protein n=1 Tax=Oncorhynchus clarkii lewisi TaxID=490388 RepID=UPI0039B9CE97
MYLATTVTDFLTKEVSLEGSAVILQIWDTAAVESLQSLGKPLYRGFHCCLTMFNITSETSFSALEVWRKEYYLSYFTIVEVEEDERKLLHCAQCCEGRAKGDIEKGFVTSNAARTALQQYKKHTSENTGQFQITCKQLEETHKCQC